MGVRHILCHIKIPRKKYFYVRKIAITLLNSNRIMFGVTNSTKQKDRIMTQKYFSALCSYSVRETISILCIFCLPSASFPGTSSGDSGNLAYAYLRCTGYSLRHVCSEHFQNVTSADHKIHGFYNASNSINEILYSY